MSTRFQKVREVAPRVKIHANVLHYVTPEDYDEWNTFLAEDMTAVCGVKVRRQLNYEPEHAHTTDPKQFAKSRWKCPACAEHPDYGLVLLSIL